MSQAFTDQLKQVVFEFETLGYNHTKKAAERVRTVCELHNWSKRNLNIAKRLGYLARLVQPA